MLAAIPLRRTLGALVGCALACLGWFTVTPPAPVAAPQSVTDCDDTGTNTLRGRIAAAAATDTISFAQDCTGATKITLTTTLTLTKNLTIDGSGHTVVVDGGCTNNCGTQNPSGGGLHREQRGDGGDQQPDDPERE
jgi:hypothetical protein